MAAGARFVDYSNWMATYVKTVKGVAQDMPLVPGAHGSLSSEHGLIMTLCFNEITDKGVRTRCNRT